QALNEAYRQLNTELQTTTPMHDEELDRYLTRHASVLEILNDVAGVEELESRTRGALADYGGAASCLKGLDQSAARAAALEQLEKSLRDLKLFNATWLDSACSQVRGGLKAADTLLRLEE